MTAPTHAGGGVFRGAADEVEFLVVQARELLAFADTRALLAEAEKLRRRLGAS